VKALLALLVWLVIVGGFSIYGYNWGKADPLGWEASVPSLRLEDALRGILSWGGLGVGIATCFVAAWLLILTVRAQRFHGGWAVAAFILVCTASVYLPVLVMTLPESFGLLPNDVRPFHGMSGLIIVGMLYRMFWTAILAVLLFIPCVFIVRARPENNAA
jgi:hypothetical protein